MPAVLRVAAHSVRTDSVSHLRPDPLPVATNGWVPFNLVQTPRQILVFQVRSSSLSSYETEPKPNGAMGKISKLLLDSLLQRSLLFSYSLSPCYCQVSFLKMAFSTCCCVFPVVSLDALSPKYAWQEEK